MNNKQTINAKRILAAGIRAIRWPLICYDMLILAAVEWFLLVVYAGAPKLSVRGLLAHALLSGLCVFLIRLGAKVYQQIWRYGGIQCYIRLIAADALASFCYIVLEALLPIERITFDRIVAICCMNLLGALTIRMIYRYAYKCGSSNTMRGKLLRMILRIFSASGVSCVSDVVDDAKRHAGVNIAIIGAGSVGVALAQELINTASSQYRPCCFVDMDSQKIGRSILNIPVLSEEDSTFELLREMKVQEVVFAIPNLSEDRRKTLYSAYMNAGFRIKKYDYPMMLSANSKRQLRQFDIEELLFRKAIQINSEKTSAYYRNKVILITGGGGSIGSELCRQIAKMEPKQLIILDIYENGVYDVQQEMRLAYGAKLDLRVEIASITHKKSLERVFEVYHPDIVINAAAHKHVPLMEHNCVEAVYNNVFGTEYLVELCEAYGTPRFMMVSTDKAVNPTNVMGATKRMCEMIVQSASTSGKTVYSATRFGNVLGSAGSVIPLFKRQIASGGPVTLTDKRIVRYFMTIPEAAQLVLESGAMAKNGELFVLDMGQPVRILDLAENMIRLSGAHGIEIIETGLRPGEKLYEELLVKTDELEKTVNNLIFVEHDAPLSREEVADKLRALHQACDTNDDDLVRDTLHQVVPTYKTPEEVNAEAEKAKEMVNVHQAVSA